MMNWKKCVLYDFIEWLKDTKNMDEMFIFALNGVLKEDIKDYISSCFYDYEDYKEIESYTLEDMEQFLEEVFLDSKGE